METRNRAWHQRNMFWAFLLIAGGVLLLLDNFHLWDLGPVWRLWPLIIVVVGLDRLVRSRTPGQRLNAYWWLFLGAWLFVSFNKVFGLTFRETWPLVLIAWGVGLILRSSMRRRINSTTEEQNHA